MKAQLNTITNASKEEFEDFLKIVEFFKEYFRKYPSIKWHISSLEKGKELFLKNNHNGQYHKGSKYIVIIHYDPCLKIINTEKTRNMLKLKNLKYDLLSNNFV